jgi:negative regulator of flagellin synthesis FlgM
MSITKIALHKIASKISIDKSETISSAGSIDKGAKVKATQSSRIEFSDNAKILTEAIGAVKKSPDVRLDKIAEIKDSLAKGSYKVDSVKIADRMLKAHLRDA